MSRRRRGAYLLEPAGTFPVIPMIDVMLNLLIFFMLISRYLPPTFAVTLPEASAAQMEERPAVTLTIDVAGRLSVDGAALEWSELPNALAGVDPERQVRIAADKEAQYDYIVKAMDACALAGLSQIALETQSGE